MWTNISGKIWNCCEYITMIAGLSVTYEWLLSTYLVESADFKRFIVMVQTYKVFITDVFGNLYFTWKSIPCGSFWVTVQQIFFSQNWTLLKRDLTLYDDSKKHTDVFVYRGQINSWDGLLPQSDRMHQIQNENLFACSFSSLQLCVVSIVGVSGELLKSFCASCNVTVVQRIFF